MYTWPENLLPLPSINYSLRTESKVTQDEMDSGYVRQRRRFSKEKDVIPVTFQLTNTQKLYFQSIYRNKLNHGADVFTMRLFLTDELALQQVKFIAGGFQISYNSGIWEVSAELEALDVALMSSEGLDAITDIIRDPEEFHLASIEIVDATNVYSDAVDAVINP